MSTIMKIIFLILSIIVALGNTKDVFRDNSTQINSNAIIGHLFEMLKYFIKNGYTEKELPVLDPSVFDYKDLDVVSGTNIVNLHVGFSNAVLTGLGEFQVHHAAFIKDQIAIDLCINFPSIIFKSGYYEMEGDVFQYIPIGGMGKLQLEISDFMFCGKVFLKQSEDEKSMLIKNISDPYFNVQKIMSNTQFDGNSDDIINAIINELLANYLNRFNKFIAKTYSNKFIDLLNPYLGKFESWRMIASLL